LSRRECGACTLCCKLVPVVVLNKEAGQRCKHQSRKGCSVYKHLALISPECRIWNCQWLGDSEGSGLRRPDHCHYVVDVMPDFVGIEPHDGGAVITMPCRQVWIDPDYPDAHRDPALRRWAERQAVERGEVVMIRWATKEQPTLVLVAPVLSDDGEWHEIWSKKADASSRWKSPLKDMHARAERRRPQAKEKPAL
jgi:hypothetical protein